MTIPDGLRYTSEHEWTQIDDGRARVGITDFAQAQLGDVVYVELPKVGTQVKRMKAFGVVESVKAASDLFCPLSGTVVEVNERLESEPELVNSEPYTAGWMVVIEMSDPTEVDALLDAQAYGGLVAAES
jgi:glycine cleavage system H protein